MPTLYLLPNLLSEGDGTLSLLPQAELSVVSDLDYLIAESEKGARHFLKKFPFPPPKTFREIALGVLNEHTSLDEKKQLIEEIKRKGKAGLISDCGMPCLADPGADLVRMSRQAGIQVKGFSGPSSLVLGLTLSGLGAQKFTFHGYLPRDEGELVREVQRIEALSKKELSTHLFIETPYRNVRVLESMLKTLSSTTWLCVACDLTGVEEFVETRQVGEWRKGPFPSIDKKPTLFLLRATL